MEKIMENTHLGSTVYPLEKQHTFSVWQYSSCGLSQSQDSYFQSQVIMNSTTLTFSVFHQVQSAA